MAPPAGTAGFVAHPTERRLVSVLFADLVSFTSLSERRDAEDMRALMDAYFSRARGVIEGHGGVVEKFIGDAVMAVWGTPVTHEDDAERAVRAALELVDAVAGLGRSMDTELQIRAGVLTGEAATAPDSGNQGMVTGDMVNTSARLQSAAPPGGVLVGEATYLAAAGGIAFEEFGDLTLKGKDQPVRAWRALRLVAERQGYNRMAIEPPFVGRVEELRLMKDLLHATGREGRARLVSVMGVGGIGKSRLAWELLKYLDGLTEDIYWHHGRCPSYGEGVSFWALGEMVRMRAGIAETDSPATSRAKLAASVAEFVTDAEERRWIQPRLGFLLGLEEDRPSGGREELFAAWRTFFERISERGTVAMVFEDLQWGDPGLLDFIDSLLEWSRNAPIYIVTLSRPDLFERRPTWGVGQRSFLALHLEPLSDAEIAQVVSGLVPSAEEGVVARIVARAEGMPLYAVETIRMLAARGALKPTGDAYEVIGDLGEISVPETLHALIASRLDALGAEDRALVQDAAILGKSFTVASLGAVTGVAPDALDARLQHLVRKEFLEFEADPRSPERGQYAFVQSIIREVAAGMLSKADRRSRHLAAAHHFESLGEDEMAAVVATHYLEALAATPAGPDADALAARARDGLGRAAERATGLGSPHQALAYLEQALGFTPAGPERASLLRQAAEAAADALRLDDHFAYLREAVAVLHDAGDRDAEMVALGVLALSMAGRGGPDTEAEVRVLVDRLSRGIRETSDELAAAELAHARANVHYFDKDVPAALASVDAALAGYEHVGEWRLWGMALDARTSLLVSAGRHQEARALTHGRLALATADNDLREMASALGFLGMVSEEWTEALRFGLQAAEVAQRGGYGTTELNALTNGLEAAVETGAWDRADAIITALRERDDLTAEGMDWLLLGETLLRSYRGDPAGARQTLDRVSPASSASHRHDLRAWCMRVSAVVSLMDGDLEAAFDTGLAALDTDPGGVNADPSSRTTGQAAVWLRDAERARAVLSRPGLSEVGSGGAVGRSLRAGIAALEGHPDEAAALYDVVLADRLAVGDPFAHALITIDAVTVLPPSRVPDGAIDTARAYLAEIGATPLLARLEAALPSATHSPTLLLSPEQAARR